MAHAEQVENVEITHNSNIEYGNSICITAVVCKVAGVSLESKYEKTRAFVIRVLVYFSLSLSGFMVTLRNNI